MSESVVVNLTFHGIGGPERGLDSGEERVWITVEAFREVLDAVQGRGDVRLTFDDGNASDFTVALPELRRRGMAASFFISAGRLGKPGYLTEEQARGLVAAGMAVGSHGMHHVAWIGLDDRQRKEEFVEARERLEGVVGRPVVKAACPFGAYDRAVLRSLRDAGYERVYTSDRGPARASEWLQARNTVHRGETRGDIERVLGTRPRGAGAAARWARLAVKRWR